MERHATWARWEPDSTGLVRWTLRSVAQEFPLLFLSGIGMLVAIALAEHSPVAVGEAIGQTVWPSLGTTSPARTLPRQAPGSLALLASIPSGGAWYPVRVRLFQNGVATGFDEAIATFVDGWLVVEGCRASFSLRPEDVLLPTDGRLVMNWKREILLDPYDRIEDRHGLGKEFFSCLRGWRRQANPAGASVFPPREVHARARAKVFAAAILGLVLLAGAGGAAWIGGTMGLAVGFTLGLLGLWRAGWATWNATRLWALR